MNQLKPFKVTYLEFAGDKMKWHFTCMAEDADHAAEQCENAYPNCVPILETELTPEEYSGTKD